MISNILEVLAVLLPMLIGVAFVTVAERKTMGSMQRRLGPNSVGYYGLLQAFADALKLLLKEYIAPTQTNIGLFFLGPIITLYFGLIGYAVVPFAANLWIADLDLGIFYILAVSSLSTYGILLSGWSANSKYAFLGSLRSTAQLISYELVLSSAILIVIMLTNSLNLNVNIQYQKAVWFMWPLLPILIIFFIGSVAECNRAPMDLAEAESELVSGFMTEHAAVIFVFFFLAEYGSILLMCILVSIFFLGGWGLSDLYLVLSLLSDLGPQTLYNVEACLPFPTEGGIEGSEAATLVQTVWNVLCGQQGGIISSLALGIKSSAIVFLFIWTRASFPRVRYDQLMSFCWTVLLPLLFGFIVLIPCVLYSFNALVCAAAPL